MQVECHATEQNTVLHLRVQGIEKEQVVDLRVKLEAAETLQQAIALTQRLVRASERVNGSSRTAPETPQSVINHKMEQ
jgi:hypothetical protein